jgi:opacity protein-like surface antigen
MALAIPAFGGTTSKEVIAPASAPCLFTWFAGGSVGYLTELEEPMYNLHVGTDTCWSIGGWNVALFGEIGYTQSSEDYRVIRQTRPVPVLRNGGSYSLEDVQDILAASNLNSGYDLDIMPLTFNVKLERALTGNLNGYFGAGLGAANVDFSAYIGNNSVSDDDWVFVGQVFAGLSYNVTPAFEVYGGARWIYYSDADLSDGGASATLELEDDFLLELGLRYNF